MTRYHRHHQRHHRLRYLDLRPTLNTLTGICQFRSAEGKQLSSTSEVDPSAVTLLRALVYPFVWSGNVANAKESRPSVWKDTRAGRVAAVWLHRTLVTCLKYGRWKVSVITSKMHPVFRQGSRSMTTLCTIQKNYIKIQAFKVSQADLLLTTAIIRNFDVKILTPRQVTLSTPSRPRC